MEKKEKRIRAPNYTIREKELLLNLMVEYKHIIENKKTDGTCIAQKKEAWKELENRFNSMSPKLHRRPIESLKKFDEKLKEDVRKKSAEKKKEFYMTGGGPPESNILDGSDDLLLSIIMEKSVYGLDSPHDSDWIDIASENTCPKDVVSEAVNIQSPEENDLLPSRKQKETSRYEFLFEEEACEEAEEKTSWEAKQDQEKLQGSDKEKLKGIDKEKWKRITARDLRKPLHPKLKRSLKEVYTPYVEGAKLSRRRPTVVPLTSSRLGEKYEELIGKKLELVECYKKEHLSRMEVLRLDIELKKKLLNSNAAVGASSTVCGLSEVMNPLL